MTVREAFETILRGDYDIKINDVMYSCYENIPAELLDKEIAYVSPRASKELDAYFRIVLK